MMTMTELFYGPVEPTFFVHPRIPGNLQPNAENCYRNPYAIYTDDALYYRSSPYVQRNAVPYTMVAPEGAPPCRPGAPGMMYPYQARYCVHGGNAALNMAPVNSAVNQAAAVVQSPAKPMQSPAKQVQSPARPGILQPRNMVNVQTVHFMVPLCCGKCEDRVKEQLLDLDDVQRVTCDQWKQKVTVTSTVAPEKLLKRVQKIKKRSTFWPQPQAANVEVSNNNQSQKLSYQGVNDENAPSI